MIPILFLFLKDFKSYYNDDKKGIHNYQIRLQSPSVFQQFRLTAGSELPFWSTATLADYDPTTKSVTMKIWAGMTNEVVRDYDLSHIVELMAKGDYNLEITTNSANE